MFTVAAEMDGDNWDLSAVVRSCRPSGSAAARDAVWAFPPLPEPLRAVEGGKGGAFVCLSQSFRNQSGFLELQEISRSSFPEVHPPPEQETVSWSPRSAAVLGSNLLPLRREVDRMSCQTPRSRRRKNQRQKKAVCHVAADDLSPDICAWRKYGQKPIKGSPYPRGYYRCSSSKGCPARKQVERSRTDSAILTITYTGEHSHPIPTNCNSLAGSTCFEFPCRSPSGCNREASPLSSATTAPELSPTTPLSASILSRPGKEEGSVDEAEVEEEEDDTEGALLVEDMEIINVDDLLFLGATTAPTVADMTRILDGEGDGDSSDHLFPLL